MLRRKSPALGLAAVLVLAVLAQAEETILYQKPSKYNEITVTQDEQGLRTLYFSKGNVRQSVVKVGDPEHLELPYTRAVLVGLALVPRPQRVLVVGLGGGSIPGILHKHYPQARIDVVDIDPDVVRVAKEYFGFREDATLRAWVADGRQFIEQARQPYDLIFLDAYGSENIPYHLATREFLQAVRRALAPNGAVVGNVFGRDLNRLYDSMVRTYQEVFDELYVLDVPNSGNRIFLALPRARRIGRDDLARAAHTISKEQRFRFDLGDLVLKGYQYAGEKNANVRVLTDRQPAVQGVK